MVIQRWQSVLLLIAAVMMALFSFCELAQIQGAIQTVSIHSYGAAVISPDGQVVNTVYVTIVAALVAILSLTGIFMFKNTRLQKRICWINIFLTIAAVCSEYLAIQSLDVPGAQAVQYNSLFFITPGVTLLALIGAWQRIRSDENKLAAADRLR